MGVLGQFHFRPAARVSAMATNGPTVTARRQVRATRSLIMTGRLQVSGASGRFRAEFEVERETR
jgi:hypothetical protein